VGATAPVGSVEQRRCRKETLLEKSTEAERGGSDWVFTSTSGLRSEKSLGIPIDSEQNFSDDGTC